MVGPPHVVGARRWRGADGPTRHLDHRVLGCRAPHRERRRPQRDDPAGRARERQPRLAGAARRPTTARHHRRRLATGLPRPRRSRRRRDVDVRTRPHLPAGPAARSAGRARAARPRDVARARGPRVAATRFGTDALGRPRARDRCRPAAARGWAGLAVAVAGVATGALPRQRRRVVGVGLVVAGVSPVRCCSLSTRGRASRPTRAASGRPSSRSSSRSAGWRRCGWAAVRQGPGASGAGQGAPPPRSSPRTRAR